MEQNPQSNSAIAAKAPLPPSSPKLHRAILRTQSNEKNKIDENQSQTNITPNNNDSTTLITLNDDKIQKHDNENNIYYYVDIPSNVVEGQNFNVKFPDGRIFGVKCPKLIPSNTGILDKKVKRNHQALVLLPSQKPPPPSSKRLAEYHIKAQEMRLRREAESKGERKSNRTSIPVDRFTHDNFDGGKVSSSGDESEPEAKNQTRVGRQYQAHIPAIEREDTYVSDSKAEYEQIWDPEKANSVIENRNEQIDLFLSLIESRQKELAMSALNEANYDVEEAKQIFTLRLFKEKDDTYEPWTFQESESFHAAMLNSDFNDNSYIIKDQKGKTKKVGFLKFLSNSCKRSPLACLLYKYNTYKGSVAEDAFQRMVNDKQDFCTVCGKDGLLICCDNCNRPYHLQCADPPLSKLPEAEEKWFCKLCSTNDHIY